MTIHLITGTYIGPNDALESGVPVRHGDTVAIATNSPDARLLRNVIPTSTEDAPKPKRRARAAQDTDTKGDER